MWRGRSRSCGTASVADLFRHGPELRARLERTLARLDDAHVGQVAAPPIGARAAVAITLVPGSDGGCELFVILRAARLRRHSAQYGLPGGRIEPGETVPGTARRELAEELAIEVPPEGVIGQLPPVDTISGFRIVPVVLWVDGPVVPIPDDVEVEECYRLPLAELATARVHRLGGGLPVLGTVIFAPTGSILQSFRDIALDGIEHAPSDGEVSAPPFTWS
jgi:8-oxo-dGTP pyrophosphatase MutT (NUDIX family)